MTRRTRDELRALMIDAGCELLERRGLAFNPPSLTYANVFQHLETTQDIRLHRSQIHGRIWDSQDHFRTDVVIETIRTVLPPESDVDDMVADLAKSAGITSIRELVEGWMLAAVVETGINDEADLGFDVFLAAQALSQENSSTSARITNTAKEYLLERMESNERRYDNVAKSLGVGFVEHLDLEHDDALKLLARTAAGITEGTRLMESLGTEARRDVQITGADGNPDTIDASTLGIVAFVERFLDLDV